MINTITCYLSQAVSLQLLAPWRKYLLVITFCKDDTLNCTFSPVKQLQELCGNEKEKVFYRIMTGNPKRITESEYNVIVDCAEALLQLWYVNETSPVSLFQRAFLKETS